MYQALIIIFIELDALGDELGFEEESSIPSYLQDAADKEQLPDFIDEAPVDATAAPKVRARSFSSCAIHLLIGSLVCRSGRGRYKSKRRRQKTNRIGLRDRIIAMLCAKGRVGLCLGFLTLFLTTALRSTLWSRSCLTLYNFSV